jgi:hypothetical protein
MKSQQMDALLMVVTDALAGLSCDDAAGVLRCALQRRRVGSPLPQQPRAGRFEDEGLRPLVRLLDTITARWAEREGLTLDEPDTVEERGFGKYEPPT